MSKLIDRRASVLACILLLVSLLATGCGAPATPEPTPVPPTATQPPPTDTPVPEPTATPEPTAVPGPVTVADLVTYERPGGANDTVSITVPGASGGPYPWFVLFEPSNGMPTMYRDFTNELLARGYGVVRAVPGEGFDGAFCIWAWLEANGPAYGLDLDRGFIFADQYGITGALLAFADAPTWTKRLEGCGHPAPSKPAIRGIATYDAWFFTVESLPLWPGGFIEYFTNVTGGDISEEEGNYVAIEVTTIPLEEWRTAGKLSENALQFVSNIVPSYFLTAPDFDAAKAPPFLLLYGDPVADPGALDIGAQVAVSDSIAFAAELERAGVEVELVEIPGATRAAPSMGTEWPVRIAEMIDEWAQKQLD